MRRALVLAGLGLLLAGGLWGWHRPSHPAPVKASLYETDMVEGLIRGLLTELNPPVPPVCFLAFGDGTTPPSAAFVSRFADSHPGVRSCNSAALPPVGRQFEVSTGQPGLVIHIIRFKEVLPGSFDVLVRFSNLPNGQDRFTYRISSVGGEWKIESRKARE
jgi:hypothetical protein